MELGRPRLLVVAPHADDETIGAGGLIAKVKDHGGEVFVQVVVNGALDFYDGQDDPVDATVRRHELGAAMEVLGVDDWEILLDDTRLVQRLDTLPRRELVDRIERDSRLAMNRIQPTWVVLPAPSFNQDHVAVHEAAVTACRPHPHRTKPFAPVVLVADMPQLAWGPARRLAPDFYVDISGPYLERKLEAYARHESQLRPDPHMASAESLRVLAQARGREISVEAAEAFECLRLVV